jgi:hypothetical protein
MAPLDVKEIYNALLKEGKTPKDAAREAQERTGFSVVTGRPIKHDLNSNKRGYFGQYK